jgi:predicted transcriptional regulator
MDEQNGALLALTADIVAAHVSNNNVATGDVANLIGQVHQALSTLGQTTEEPATARREPVVSARAAIKPESITCLVCGLKAKLLKRHLSTAHQLTTQEYREEFGLRPDYPMVAPNYAEKRRDLAVKSGLGRQGRAAKAAAPAAAPKRGRGRPAKEG